MAQGMRKNSRKEQITNQQDYIDRQILDQYNGLLTGEKWSKMYDLFIRDQDRLSCAVYDYLRKKQ